MKKITYLFLLFGIILNAGEKLFAADSLEHFVTKDGQHYCSIFMKNDYKSCEEFGIVYEGEKVVSGEKPFFSSGFPKIEIIAIGNVNYCVEGTAADMGREVDMEKCVNEGISAPNSGSNTQDSNSVEDSQNMIEGLSGSTDGGDQEVTGVQVQSEFAISQDKNGASGSEVSDATMSGEIAKVTTMTSKASCQVNGKSVDCAELANGVKSVIKTGLWIIVILVVTGAISLIFSLWMLFHAITHPISSKALWILVIFFFMPLGAIFYYFIVKKKFMEPLPSAETFLKTGDSTLFEKSPLGPTLQSIPVLSATPNVGGDQFSSITQSVTIEPSVPGVGFPVDISIQAGVTTPLPTPDAQSVPVVSPISPTTQWDSGVSQAAVSPVSQIATPVPPVAPPVIPQTQQVTPPPVAPVSPVIPATPVAPVTPVVPAAPVAPVQPIYPNPQVPPVTPQVPPMTPAPTIPPVTTPPAPNPQGPTY